MRLGRVYRGDRQRANGCGVCPPFLRRCLGLAIIGQSTRRESDQTVGQGVKMNKKQLAKAFNFNEQDLFANRDGHLSETQRQRIRQLRNVSLMILGALVILMIVGATQVSTTPSVLIFSLAILLRRLERLIFHHVTLRSDRVTTYFGRIQLKINNRRSGQLRIADADGLRTFQITSNQLLSLHDRDYYKVYVVPKLDTILSVEPVNLNRTDDDAEAYTVDLSALTQEESESEKPKRGTVVLGDDGELSFSRDSST